MLRAVSAEVRQRGKVHGIGNLHQRELFVVEVFAENRNSDAVDVGTNGVSRGSLHGAREVFQRYMQLDRKSTRLNSSHANISYAVFCLKKKKIKTNNQC